MRARGLLLGLAALLPLVSFASAAYVPVYVMLPLDTIGNDGRLNLQMSWLQQLKSAGVDGVMTDVWWGIVERNAPRDYNWEPYRQLFAMCANVGLKVQVVMSFHQCGGNVGDTCNIPLPPWVLGVGNQNPNIFYTDREGHRDREYLSLGVDNQPLFYGRTALDMYGDFMKSFAANFTNYLGSTVVEVEVGMGPAGELRYPSYQLQDNLWSFCGVGEFQCYDQYMLADLRAAASKAGHSDWGNGGPNNAGTYNSRPDNTGFFGSGFDNYASPYGRFFLAWYAQKLVDHGDGVLSRARAAFGNRVALSGKVSGIHWWYRSNSHAAELTAGYYNTNGNDGYAAIANMFAKYGAHFDFTCMEMQDNEQPNDCACGPAELVVQTQNAAFAAGIGYGGENALPRYDTTAYNQILKQSFRAGARPIASFTYLRLSSTLLGGGNWSNFVSFVNQMHNVGPSNAATAARVPLRGQALSVLDDDEGSA